MPTDKHYNPQICSRLRILFAAEDWDGLQVYLASLSNAHFRTAGYLIGERMLADASSGTFWTVMKLLVDWQPKAFLVTLAKSAARRLKAGTLSLDDAGFADLAGTLQGSVHIIDREKLLLQWLPAMTEPVVIEQLFDAMNTPTHRRIDFLLRTDGVPAGYILLRTLRREEHDHALLARTCTSLIRKGDALSFNLASILRAYFDLSEVHGVFSLQIQPYELSRLDTDYDTFKRLARRV